MSTLYIAAQVGLQYVPLGIGIYIIFIVLSFPDLTVQGSFGLGGAALAMGISQWGLSPLASIILATAIGGAAGAITGLLHVRFRVSALLAGILMATALWSIALFLMSGQANISLIGKSDIYSHFQAIGLSLQASYVVVAGIACAICAVIVIWLLTTEYGLALRASGIRIQTARALGIRTEHRQVVGCVLANALAALSGALVVEQESFMDISIQVGVIVVGIAAVAIGRSISPWLRPVPSMIAVCIGIYLYQLAITWTLDLGWSPNATELISAAIVVIFLLVRSHIPLYWKTLRKDGRTGPRRAHLTYVEDDTVVPII